MKKNVLFAVLLMASAGFNTVVLAQITITLADANAFNTVGNVITTHQDTTTLSVNIGSPGATSWDFSSLKSHVTVPFSSVTPSSTPYSSHFPNANVVFKYSDKMEGDSADLWQYTTQQSDKYLMNGFMLHALMGTDTLLIKAVYSPSQLLYPIPFTYNSNWISNYAVTTDMYFMGMSLPMGTSNYTETAKADAWGNLKMPGGAVVQALRVKTDSRSLSEGVKDRTITYSFITKSGTAISLMASDTTSPDSGIIPITEGITWSSINSNVGIENNVQLQPRYNLLQNKPNPIRSTTNIQYSIGDAQFVSLKVYNYLGAEVATLVNGKKAAGSYEVAFDTSTLPPGNYFYNLRAGNFSDTKKMIIVR